MKYFKDSDQITALIVFMAFLFLALLGCEKELEDEPNDTLPITADSVIVHESISGVRSGRVYPVFYTESFTIDNFLFAASANYTNEQYLFNKDSINSITFVRQDPEIVGIGDTKYGIYKVIIDFKGWSDFEMVCFVKNRPGSGYKIIAEGKNYGQGIRFYLVYKRDVQKLRYYDQQYRVWKNKYRYFVNGFDFSYRDFIPSTLEKSDIFRLEHRP